MSRRKYWLNVSGPEIGDNLVCHYDNKKELRNRWQKDAEDFVREQGVDPVADDWYPYVRVHFWGDKSCGDPSGFWNRFTEKERDDTRRKMMADMVEAGVFMRKEDYNKEHGIYKKDELFYGM
jgi:hypothetical protein